MACLLMYLLHTGAFGAWDTKGCKEVTRVEGRVDCECTQVGHFGILLVSLLES